MKKLVLIVSALAFSTMAGVEPSAQYESCHDKTPSGCTAVTFDTAVCPTFCGGDDDPIQFVPVGDGGNGLYVAFSTIENPSTGVRTNNVTMWVLELACGQSADILVFGTGYGCRNTAEFGPALDVERVNHIVRNCIGLSGTVEVAFVVPHGHADHINPEFVHTLVANGYTIDKIYVHIDDQGATKSLPAVSGCPSSVFTQVEKNPTTGIFQPFGTADQCNTNPDNGCEQTWSHANVKSFDTTLGKTWFRGRDGHTRGSVDLVIDYLGNEAERYLVYGSATPCTVVSNNCYIDPFTGTKRTPTCDLPGVQWAIAAHGNIVLRPAPPASCP